MLATHRSFSLFLFPFFFTYIYIYTYIQQPGSEVNVGEAGEQLLNILDAAENVGKQTLIATHLSNIEIAMPQRYPI